MSPFEFASPCFWPRFADIADRLVLADKIEAMVKARAAHIHKENRERRIQVDADARAPTMTNKAIASIMAAIEDGLLAVCVSTLPLSNDDARSAAGLSTRDWVDQAHQG